MLSVNPPSQLRAGILLPLIKETLQVARRALDPANLRLDRVVRLRKCHAILRHVLALKELLRVRKIFLRREAGVAGADEVLGCRGRFETLV